jgi:hypothetical protein
VFVGLAFLYPDFMISPGPLQTGHQALATDCFACHAPMRGATSQNCITCHAAADIGLRSTKGIARASLTQKTAFHQRLATQSCTGCHAEHQGTVLASGSKPTFSHDLLQLAVRSQCATCHIAPVSALHQAASTNCAQCHTQSAWKPATFAHAKLFVLEGPHNTPCATCHVGEVFTRYTCYGCHEHQPDRIRAKHVREGLTNFENCVQCHRSASGEHGDGGRGERSEGRRKRD